MKITVFDKATGQILRVVNCPQQDVLAQFDADTQGFIEGEYPDDAFYIVDLAAVPIPPSPSPAHVFSYTARAWLDPRSLRQRQDAQWERIKAAREAFFNAPLSTPFGVFDSDPVSRTRITDAVLMLQTLTSLGQPANIDFTLANDSVVTLDAMQMVTVGLLLGQKVQTAFGISRLRREAIYSATTPEAVEAVTW